MTNDVEFFMKRSLVRFVFCICIIGKRETIYGILLLML